MNFVKHIGYFALAVLTFFGCKKKDDQKTVQLHTEYGGLIPSKYVIYEAREIFHDDDSGVHDTTDYLLKSKVGQVYVDLQGRPGFEIERYRSFDNGSTWIFKDKWYGVLTTKSLEIVEENERKLRLIFAPKLKEKWDLNAYNSQDESILEYIEIHKSTTINGQVFDSTVVVQEDDLFSLVDYKKQTETYAKGVGLINKYYKDLTINNFDTLDVVKGREYFLTLIEHGFE